MLNVIVLTASVGLTEIEVSEAKGVCGGVVKSVRANEVWLH